MVKGGFKWLKLLPRLEVKLLPVARKLGWLEVVKPENLHRISVLGKPQGSQKFYMAPQDLQNSKRTKSVKLDVGFVQLDVPVRVGCPMVIYYALWPGGNLYASVYLLQKEASLMRGGVKTILICRYKHRYWNSVRDYIGLARRHQ